ncbi:MAG: hypothetical protein EOO11_21350 [Chitinophagaceae bacterium]|nr:MAG: hypothetical protein EOO11_21350 [Chitinophagaceae bacterium]
MMKSLRVPHELLALSQMQRASSREAGAPLYLPAFETAILGEPNPEDDLTAEADFGAEAGGLFTIGNDEDDDFY